MAFTNALQKPVSKSWLFEIVDSESGMISESFTLILPPTGISIKEPQRVSITKTFGNAFVDDYGADNIQITIKGFSGTSHTFPTFQTKGAGSRSIKGITSSMTSVNLSKEYTGKDAFYTFRDTIIRYKGTDNWDKKELIVYDLADEQSYKCILLDFSLDRDAGQPLNRYPFTISLFVYQTMENYTPKVSAVSIAKNPLAMLDAIDAVLGAVEGLFQDIQGIVNQAYIVKAIALTMRSRINNITTATAGLLTSPLDIAKSLVDATFAMVGIAADTYNAGKYVAERYSQAEELVLQALNDGLKIYGYQISEGWQASKTLTIETNTGMDTSGDVPIPSSDDKDYVFSGIRVYTVKGQDTLQGIAQSELGDSNLWPYIASVNTDVGSNADISPGDTLYIPVQTEISEGVNKEQFILTEDVVRDPYGTDLLLDADGNIIVQESGDFALVSGASNVKQAIDLRLNTEVGSMLKQSAFGITASAGMAGTTMAVSYLRMAIQSTVVSDARVESVSDLNVSLGSDTIAVGMTITLVGAETTLPVTVTI